MAVPEELLELGGWEKEKNAHKHLKQAFIPSPKAVTLPSPQAQGVWERLPLGAAGGKGSCGVQGEALLTSAV